MNRPRLSLYGREYCHLCTQMLEALAPYREQVDILWVDIDDDDALEERYKLLIPVLMAGEVEICHYHLDRRALDAYLSRLG